MAEDQEADMTCFRNFSTNTDSRVQANMTELTNETPRAVVTDTSEPRPSGGRTISETKLMEEGKLLRNSIMLSVARGNLKRPTKSGMRYNDEGLIHVTHKETFQLLMLSSKVFLNCLLLFYYLFFKLF